MSEPLLKVTVADGKYTVILPEDGSLHALRYGEKWRDLIGDGMVLALVQRIEELESGLGKLLHYLPDSQGQESPDNWKWCWNELDDSSQEEVKKVREETNKLLSDE